MRALPQKQMRSGCRGLGLALVGAVVLLVLRLEFEVFGRGQIIALETHDHGSSPEREVAR